MSDGLERQWLTYGAPHLDLRDFIDRAVIDARRPYERLKDFPKVARASAEMLARVKDKFADVVAKV